MHNFLPRLLHTITGQPRYKPEIKWSQNCWTHNLFRFYELIFWRRWGIRAEMTSWGWKENGKEGYGYECYTWESLIAHTEGIVRQYLKNLFNFEFVWIPLPQLSFANMMWRDNPLIPIAYLVIAFDATSNGIDENAQSVTVSHTVTGSNTMLVSGACQNGDGGAGDLTSVKYATVAMTLEQTAIRTADSEVHQTTLAAPTTGTNNNIFTSSLGAGRRVYLGNISLTGTAQSAYVDVKNTANGSSTAPSVSVTTTVANSWVLDTVQEGSTSALTVGGSQTQRYNNTTAVRNFAGSTQATTNTGAYTMSWTLAASQTWEIAAIAIKPPATAVLTHPFMMTGIGG